MSLSDNHIFNTQSTAHDRVDDAGGVAASNEACRFWYVAIVSNKAENKTSERLSSYGYQTYVASQEEVKQWKDGRRKKVKRIVLPGLVFIKATEQERRRTLTDNLVNRYMSDRAANRPAGLNAPPAVIPDEQIERLRYMLGHAGTSVSFSERPLRAGTKVRVLRGALRGLEGEIAPPVPKTSTEDVTLNVRIDYLGCAQLAIARADLKLID